VIQNGENLPRLASNYLNSAPHSPRPRTRTSRHGLSSQIDLLIGGAVIRPSTALNLSLVVSSSLSVAVEPAGRGVARTTNPKLGEEVLVRLSLEPGNREIDDRLNGGRDVLLVAPNSCSLDLLEGVDAVGQLLVACSRSLRVADLSEAVDSCLKEINGGAVLSPLPLKLL
jgi:hypothetical protein